MTADEARKISWLIFLFLIFNCGSNLFPPGELTILGVYKYHNKWYFIFG